MHTLNETTEKYLENNGITIRFLAEYIGCEYTKCVKWLKGKSNLSVAQTKKVHEFLNGKHVKTIQEVLKQECD